MAGNKGSLDTIFFKKLKSISFGNLYFFLFFSMLSGVFSGVFSGMFSGAFSGVFSGRGGRLAPEATLSETIEKYQKNQKPRSLAL